MGITRRITRHVETRLEYRLSAVRSNLPEADYVGNTVGLSVRVGL